MGAKSMRMALGLRQAAILAVVSTGLSGWTATSAQALPPDFVLSCENGRSYPIRARAVTVDGDMVTGYLSTGRRHHIHIRLIPMGAGYRYVAPGLWADGWRTDASLNFGPSRSVGCTVVRE
jgi:hypothetical protein